MPNIDTSLVDTAAPTLGGQGEDLTHAVQASDTQRKIMQAQQDPRLQAPTYSHSPNSFPHWSQGDKDTYDVMHTSKTDPLNQFWGAHPPDFDAGGWNARQAEMKVGI